MEGCPLQLGIYFVPAIPRMSLGESFSNDLSALPFAFQVALVKFKVKVNGRNVFWPSLGF